MKSRFSLIILAMLIAAAPGCKKPGKNITAIPGGNSVVAKNDAPGGPQRTTYTPKPIGSSGPISLGPDLGSGNLKPVNSLDPTGGSNEPGAPGGRVNGPEDPSILASQTIYFDFDKSSIRPSETSKLAAVASYLKNTPTAHLKIAGNCDERGTEEYNRSLGERRALAAMDHLVKQEGISGDRITTVSNSEDDAADPGHDESAWSKNRRDEFIVITAQ